LCQILDRFLRGKLLRKITIDKIGNKTRKAYSSDLKHEEWELIAPLLPVRRDKRGAKILHTRQELFNAMFYANRQRITWEALPHDFPPYETVYDYFYKLNKQGVWPTIMDQLRQKARLQVGREAEPRVVVLDSQLAKIIEKGGGVATTRTR
jgi:putative transposase